jgi:hypothetical protein
MSRRYGFFFCAILLLTAVLVACGGTETPTDTPRPPTPTTAPPTATTGPPTATPTTAPTATPTVPPPTATPTTAPPTATSTTAPTATRAASSATTGTTAAGSTTAGAGLTTYTDAQGRFSFSRPSAWTQQSPPGQDIVVQFNGNSPLLSANIVVTPLPSAVSPDQYLPLVLNQLKTSFPDMATIGTTQTSVGGEQGTQIDYTATASGTKVYFSQIYVIHKGTAYVLTLACQQADVDQAKQQAGVVIQTWKFLT